MELQYYGANCLRIIGKKASITIDDNLKELGLTNITKSQDIALYTSPTFIKNTIARLVIADPGQYEVSDASVQGVAARANTEEANAPKSATMFKIVIDDIRIAIIGHVFPELKDEQLEALGPIDILCIPVGGNGYTLDALGALEIIKKIEPRIIIPTHYADAALKYPVPQTELSEILKNLAMEPTQTVPKLKIKSQEIPENTQLIILERQ